MTREEVRSIAMEISEMVEDREDVMEKLKSIMDNWPDGSDWEGKYNELKGKYRERFFSDYKPDNNDDGIIETVPDEPEPEVVDYKVFEEE